MNGVDTSLTENYSNVIGTDTSFGQGVIAASDTSPVYTADPAAPTPPTPPGGTPVAGSAPGIFAGLGSFFGFGASALPRVYSPAPGVTLNPQALIQRTLFDTYNTNPPQTSLNITTIAISGGFLFLIYVLVKKFA